MNMDTVEEETFRVDRLVLYYICTQYYFTNNESVLTLCFISISGKKENILKYYLNKITNKSYSY